MSNKCLEDELVITTIIMFSLRELNFTLFIFGFWICFKFYLLTFELCFDLIRHWIHLGTRSSYSE